MRGPLIALGMALAFMLGGYYYEFIYPPNKLKRATQVVLDEFGAAVATQDREKIGAFLTHWLEEDAMVKLKIEFFTMTHTQQGADIVQEFDKEEFVHFIDNTLYSLESYSFDASVGEFELADDGQTAKLKFAGNPHASGQSYYGGIGIGMQFAINMKCDAGVIIREEKPFARDVDCHLEFRSSPKPSERDKLKDPELYRQFMTR